MRATTVRHALLSLCNAGLILACDDGDVSPSRALTSAGASQALSPSVEAAGTTTRLRFERDVVQAGFSSQTPECGTVVDVFATAGFEHITERKNCKLAKRDFAITGYYFPNDTNDMKVGKWKLQPGPRIF